MNHTLDTEIVFDKIQCPLKIKVLERLEIQEICLNTIKTTYNMLAHREH